MKIRIAICTALLLVGCGSSTVAASSPTPAPRVETISGGGYLITDNQATVWHGRIDGKECIAWKYYDGSGISCNWEKQ